MISTLFAKITYKYAYKLIGAMLHRMPPLFIIFFLSYYKQNMAVQNV